MKWNLCDNSCLKKGRSGKMWLWLTLLPIPHSKWMFSVPYTDNKALSGSARLPVYEGYMCRLCVSNVTEKRKEVCVECRRASSPYETKGDFCLFGGTMWGCEAVHRAQNVCHVFCKCAFFFVNTTPFGRGSNALPYLDSRVTWVYSWILNRNKKTA